MYPVGGPADTSLQPRDLNRFARQSSSFERSRAFLPPKGNSRGALVDRVSSPWTRVWNGTPTCQADRYLFRIVLWMNQFIRGVPPSSSDWINNDLRGRTGYPPNNDALAAPHSK